MEPTKRNRPDAADHDVNRMVNSDIGEMVSPVNGQYTGVTMSTHMQSSVRRGVPETVEKVISLLASPFWTRRVIF